MQKIKIILITLVAGLMLFAGAKSVDAAKYVSIQKLPGFINYTDFTLSCTTDGSTAQFYSTKDGGSFTPFGPAITLNSSTPCQVQVTGLQFGSEGKFDFEVIVDSTPGSVTNDNQTSTTLDTTPTGPVSDFGKARMNGNTQYQLSWKNPTDSDYAKVFIYRGTVAGFSADDSHKVAEVGGNPGDTMTWVDGALDPNQAYFYAIRALDKAGNSSSLVGDAGATTTIVTTPKPGTSSGGKVTQLPQESGAGSVLGTEASASPTASGTPVSYSYPTPQPGGIFTWIKGHKKISLGIAAILALLGYGAYSLTKRK